MATHLFTSKSSSATPLCSCWSRPTTRPLPLLAAVFRPPRGGPRRDRPTGHLHDQNRSADRRPLAGGRHCHRASCCHYFKLPPAEQETEVGESGTPRGFSGGVWEQAIQIGSVGRAECLLLGVMLNFTWVSAACSIGRHAAAPLSSAAMATFGTRWLALFEK